jgi:hypothetical protein
MATAGRALRPYAKKKSSPIVMPKSTAEWEKLMRVVIALAEARGDRRAPGLRKAMVDGKAERTLRLMGIIHPGDLPRVFPTKV